MLTPKRPSDEADRMVSLRQHQVLDKGREEVFDEITDLAAAICEAPMALISFLDHERVWFKSKVGIAANEVARDLSFCGHAILQRTLFVVPDATQDERFKDNPLVMEEPKIRFYAGTQLIDRGGHALGMMCVLDTKPRQLRSSQQRALRVLARLVMTELEVRQSTNQVRRLEVEAANLRLVRTMANSLLHEMGNAIVPLSTHQQLFAERYYDSEFRESLGAALSEGVRRISRLISQMRHLAQEVELALEPVLIQSVVEEAYKTAVREQGAQSARLHFDPAPDPILINGDVAALTHAFSEIILNALQANPSNPEVDVRCAVQEHDGSRPEVIIDFFDNGIGFASETAEKAMDPFFTTRNVGPGLGLSVARKVIEKHNGSIEINSVADNGCSSVRIHLPLPTAQAQAC